AYFAAIDAHGSPVNVSRDLLRASPPVREQADLVLMRVEQISTAAPARSGTIRPQSALGYPELQPAATGCAVVPEGAASAEFQVVAPPGGLVIRPGPGRSAVVGVARSSTPPTAIGLSSVHGGGESEFVPPRDASPVPWRFELTAEQAVTVCSGAK